MLAIADGRIEHAIDDLAVVYDREIEIRQVSAFELERAIERLCGGADSPIAPDGLVEEGHESHADVRQLASQAPIVKYVNLLIRDAHELGASDIHVETNEAGLEVRFRVDGVLTAASDRPPQRQDAVVSRLKLLADLDIAERRKPQDGRIRVRLERAELDLRVSTVPTINGESVVLRLLDGGGRPASLRELGMPGPMLDVFRRACSRSHGLILVTGPTGSGKTTTLYAALQQRVGGREKIVTIEDPIEYRLPGVTQVPIHRKSGMTFAAALRSILRQDPDVVMIGEMRDPETAQLAVQAAMTGHLVLATLHTNNSVAAIPRLIDLGVPPYLISACLELVLAQRLARRVCSDCQMDVLLDASSPVEVIGASDGAADAELQCARCRGSGFRGRVAIFELLPISAAFRSAISRNASPSDLGVIAEHEGFEGLLIDAAAKVHRGLTTTEEAHRVIE